MGKRSRRPERTKINFKELQKRVAHSENVQKRRLTRADVSTVLESFIEQMLESIIEFEEIHIRGFGQLYRFEKAKRRVIHPQTKEELIIAPHFEVNFKMGSEMKRALGFEDKKQPKKNKSDDDIIPTDF